MKVWVGYRVVTNLNDQWKIVEKVFSDEVKALLWAEDPGFKEAAPNFDGEPLEWREIQEWPVE